MKTNNASIETGDLVVYTTEWTRNNPWMKFKEPKGLIVETGKYTGNRNCMVLWEDGKLTLANLKDFDLIAAGSVA